VAAVHRELTRVRALFIAVAAVVATACGRPAVSLPDWSGIWLPDIEDQFKQIDGNPLPWTPEVAAEVQRLTAAEAAGHPKAVRQLPARGDATDGLKIGDRVSVVVAPLRDGSHGGWCRGVTLLHSGKKLEC